jgi:hypothetical protein
VASALGVKDVAAHQPWQAAAQALDEDRHGLGIADLGLVRDPCSGDPSKGDPENLRSYLLSSFRT